MTTPLDLAAIRARLEAATPGPWSTDEAPRLGGSVSAVIDGHARQVAEATGQAAQFDHRAAPEVVQRANAAFIAHARTDVGDLLDECERREICWSCPDCAFTFAAYHTNTDGSTTCPLCERDAALAEVARLTEWRNAVSGAVKRAPEFAPGQWAGDKEGWGYHFEIINFLHRDRVQLRAELARLQSQLAHLTESAGEDSCADVLTKANAEVTELDTQLQDTQADYGALEAEREAIDSRIATIADEAFGPFPVQTPEENLTAIERGIFRLRAERLAEDAVVEAAEQFADIPGDTVAIADLGDLLDAVQKLKAVRKADES